MSKQGKFIVLEGGEGTGKTTCVMAMHEELKRQGYNVVLTREPGGTIFGETMRGFLLSAKNEGGSPDVLSQLFLFMASRTEHINKLILPALREGNIVLCDRFSWSTYAYQVAGENRPDLEWVMWTIDAIARGARTGDQVALGPFLKPDLTVLLAGDPIACLERAKRRGTELTRFDAREMEFHNRVHDGFRRAFKYESTPQLLVDAQKSAEEVARIVLDEILAVISK
jgi:dTMP kinase